MLYCKFNNYYHELINCSIYANINAFGIILSIPRSPLATHINHIIQYRQKLKCITIKYLFSKAMESKKTKKPAQ